MTEEDLKFLEECANEGATEIFKKCLNQKIKKVFLDGEDVLRFEFGNGLKVKIFDDGQSCCENRYMRTDDDLNYYSDSIFLGAEIKDVYEEEEDGEPHEIQFFEIKTDKGVISFSNHNEHNGYYGGFDIKFGEEEI